MTMKKEYIQLVTTISSKDEADKLASYLVKQRLAACVQVCGPVNSFYHWQGKLENDEEYQLLIKSRLDLYNDLELEIKKNHPYETPEIIALPIVDGSKEYLSWLEEELCNNP